MRISDWSSDVCSSDLTAADGQRALGFTGLDRGGLGGVVVVVAIVVPAGRLGRLERGKGGGRTRRNRVDRNLSAPVLYSLLTGDAVCRRPYKRLTDRACILRSDVSRDGKKCVKT